MIYWIGWVTNKLFSNVPRLIHLPSPGCGTLLCLEALWDCSMCPLTMTSQRNRKALRVAGPHFQICLHKKLKELIFWRHIEFIAIKTKLDILTGHDTIDVWLICYPFPFYTFKYVLRHTRFFHEWISSEISINQNRKQPARTKKVLKGERFLDIAYLKSRTLAVELLVRHVQDFRVFPRTVGDHPELTDDVALSKEMFPLPLSYHLPSQSTGRVQDPSEFHKILVYSNVGKYFTKLEFPILSLHKNWKLVKI